MGREKRISLYRFFWFWKLQFWIEKVLLSLSLGDAVLGIEHVGSTSIWGIPAKPIVDISIAVEDYEQIFWMVPVLESLGYSYLGENNDLREYALERTGILASKLFICEPDGEKWQARIRFRDYLKVHSKERQAYANLKEKLARQYAKDLLSYQRSKLPFIQEILSYL